MTRSKFRIHTQILTLWLAMLSLGGLLTTTQAYAEDPTTLSIESKEDKGFMGAISSLGQKFGFSSNQEPFLPPEQAFMLSVDVANHSQLNATWNIADGYYLYKDKFSFSLENSPGVTIGTPTPPPGKEKEDEAFGLMEVFYNEVTIPIPLVRQEKAPTEIIVVAKYQGCAEIGFCYPPMKQEFVLSLPKVDSVIQPPKSANASPLTEQDRYAQGLSQDNILVSMLTFFGLGLLLTFTPCVLPMIPILSSIIAGQGSNITTSKAFWLSFTYVLAMSITYTVAGVTAGMFGSNLQAAFQNPWVLGSFATLFVILSFSMFGFYELQMPQKWQTKLTEMSNKQQGGTFIGVGIMGLLSALIVGPCLAAPLAGALIYIGQTGDAVLGGSALFALSLGMGIPLLIIGTSAGKLLPKAGPWMNTIKSIFGVLLIGVAIWMVERIIPESVALALWGTLLVVCAVYLGALEHLQPEASGWHKLWKGTGLVFLIYGGIMLIGAAAGGKDPLNPLANFKSAGAATIIAPMNQLTFKKVKGLDELNSAIRKANAQGKPVMLDFYADWCISCKQMERSTFSSPKVIASLNNAVLLKTDVTANDEIDQALMKNFGIIGPPSILFFNTQGKELAQNRLVGFLDADAFANHVSRTLN